MKRKLFFLLALMLGFVSGIKAQTDVTSTYLTNADFSSTTGWTLNASSQYHSEGNGLIGTYVVYGTAATVDASHLSTEYCFGLNARWSTNYTSYQQTTTLPAGNYLLTYDVENTNNGTTNATYDNLFYVQVGETKHYDTSTEWMMGNRAWTTHIISFSLASESSVTISLGYGTGSNNFAQANTPALYVSHLKLTYSASNALDYTSKITNNSFETGDLTGWSIPAASSDTGVKDNVDPYTTTGIDGSKLFNTWWQGVPLTQEITTGIPNGKYVIKASLAGSDDGANAKLFLLGPTASEHSNVIEIYKGTKGVFHDYAFEVLVTSKSITLGAVGGNDAGEYVPGGHWWYKADNFRLYYLGEDLSMYKVPLETAQAYAKGIDQEAPMKATILTALQSAITTYGDRAWTTFESSDDIIEAIDALNGAADNASTSISNYESALSILNAASSLDAAGQASYAANETVAAIQSAYDDRTLESVSSDQQTACAAALRAAALAQTTENSDMTLAIVNPSFETASSTGWTVESTGSNVNLVFPNTTAFTLKDGTYFAERYQPNGTIEINQTLTVVSAGVYKVEVSALARGDISSANFYANSVSTPITIVDEANDYSVNVALDANSNLKIGLTVVATASGGTSWLAFDNFRLTYLGGLPDVEAVTGKMNATVEAAQTAAIEAYEANKTVANYNAASAAIAAAQASKDAYTTGKSALDKVEDILANTNVYTDDAYTTFSGAYTTAAAKYEAGTWTNEEATGYKNTTLGTGWHSTASVDDFLISAWDVNPRDWSTYHINTWSTTGDSGNPNMYTPCFEYWTGDASTLAEKEMTATLGGFDPGATYKISALVCLGVNTGVDASTTPTGATLQLNDGTPVSVCTGSRIASTRFYEGTFEANATVGVDGNLVVKLHVDGESTNVSWMTWRNVKYTKTGDAPANWSANLKVNDGKLGTFIASFNITLPAGVKAYSATATETEVKLTKIAEGGEELAAGTPVIIFGDGFSVDETFYGVPEITDNQTEGALTGILNEEEMTITSGNYVLQTQDDVQAFYRLAENATGKLNRCYVTANAGVGGARLVISIDDDPTAINAIEAADAETEGLKDGKYLIENKIVLVKNGVKYSANGQILK